MSATVTRTGLCCVIAVGLAACRPPETPAAPRPKSDSSTRRALTIRDYVRAPLVSPSSTSQESLRIVSLAPTLTEILCALGRRDWIVGRTSYCTHPPDVREVPSVGALTNLNAERLVRLEPDLILVSGQSRTQTERLKRLNLRFESIPDTGLEDVFSAIVRVGVLTGRAAAAAELNAAIRADLNAVTKRYADVAPARVLILTATLSDPPAPPFVGGAGSFYDELLRLAGHTNAAAPAGRAFAPLSLEFILRADPDVIIELDADGSARPGGEAQALKVWKKIGPLSAVANRRVRVLTGTQHYLLGPRIAQTFHEICAAITGEPIE